MSMRMRMCMIFSRQSYLKIYSLKKKQKKTVVANFQNLVLCLEKKKTKDIQFNFNKNNFNWWVALIFDEILTRDKKDKITH